MARCGRGDDQIYRAYAAVLARAGQLALNVPGPGEGAVLGGEARHAGVRQARLQPGATAERRVQKFQGGGSGGIVVQFIGVLAGEA